MISGLDPTDELNNQIDIENPHGQDNSEQNPKLR